MDDRKQDISDPGPAGAGNGTAKPDEGATPRAAVPRANAAESGPAPARPDEEYGVRTRLPDAGQWCSVPITGSRPGQRFFELDEDFAVRAAREADEAAIEELTGSRPFIGALEPEADHDARLRLELWALRVGRPVAAAGDGTKAGPEAPSGFGWGAVIRPLLVGVVLALLGTGFYRAVIRERPASTGAGVLATAFVDAPGLHVRSGPGGNTAILTTLLRGDPVQVIGQDLRDPSWVHVRVGGVEGWVSGRYLAERAAPAPAAAAAQSPGVRPRVTMQYQETGDRDKVSGVLAALRRHDEWRVGQAEHVLPSGENRAEVYGGLRFYFEADSALARAVCTEVVAELARQGMTVTLPLWPMVTGQREGRFNASPGLIEVWISPLPAAAGGPVPPGRCGR